MRKFLTFAVLLGVAGLAYVRLAPSDPADWHVDPDVAGSAGVGRAYAPLEESAIYTVPPGKLLERLDEIATSDGRTVQLAGSAKEGRITYVTRSNVIGFPDYTSVKAVAHDGGTKLAIYARLRFGVSDFGVNAGRVSGWLEKLQPLAE